MDLRPRRPSNMSLKLIVIEVVEKKMEMEEGGRVAKIFKGKKGRDVDL